ncbi:MAG TPA: hypothetical protein PLK34_02300 [Candidatus Pacearchaeota archaeon]|nr:hypothetical protein [Candidatus Pacearchaeota archaeon]
MKNAITPQDKKYCEMYFRGKTKQEREIETGVILAHINITGGAGDEFIYIPSREISVWGNFFFAKKINGDSRNRASAYRVLALDFTNYYIGQFEPDEGNKRCFKARINKKEEALEEIVGKI